jgi:AcrR family transcriptional regulator
MPRLWTDTLAEHRQAVRDATLDAVGLLAGTRGPYQLSMSAIAAHAGIGRATLYKYFPDVGSILLAWHERAIDAHLVELAALAARPGTPLTRLHAVLGAYAAIEHGHHDHPLAPALHGAPHHLEGRRRLGELLTALLRDAAQAGQLRDDIAPAELAVYCINALGAAREAPDAAAAARVADVTADGLLRPSAARAGRLGRGARSQAQR